MGLDWGTVPQWITAIVAISAVIVAAIGIGVQRSVARKRAAVDFFLKTEMDPHLLKAYDEFWQGTRFMTTMTTEEFCTSHDENVRKHYFSVRKYLNLHELMAVAIEAKMFDDETCFHFWRNEFFRMVDEARPVINYVRARPGREEVYISLIGLYDEWKAIASRLPKLSRSNPLPSA
jgi:hypothetical protein